MREQPENTHIKHIQLKIKIIEEVYQICLIHDRFSLIH